MLVQVSFYSNIDYKSIAVLRQSWQEHEYSLIKIYKLHPINPMAITKM